MAAIALTQSAALGLASTASFSGTSDTVPIPSWARTVHVYRAGTAITDDCTIAIPVVTNGVTTTITLICQAGGVITPWPITRQGQDASAAYPGNITIAGTAAVATRVFFSAGSFSGPS
jgi:hypothetical protein